MLDRFPKAIEQLQLDHRNMTRLLDILRAELDAYRVGGTPDFDLLRSVMEYTLHYPDLCHHPKEDMIFRCLLRRDPGAGARVGDLIAEHTRLAELSRKLAAALHNVAHDVEVPREWLERLVEEYIAGNRRHIAAEEQRFFPLAIVTLTDEDWDEIDASVTAKDDPLFGGRMVGEFRGLYDRIMRLNV
jgi:hemerythrin-like domain-containing protein